MSDNIQNNQQHNAYSRNIENNNRLMIYHPQRVPVHERNLQIACGGKTVYEFLKDEITQSFNSIPSDDVVREWIITKPFFILDFNVLSAHKHREHFVYPPCEIALSKFDILNGITDELHEFLYFEGLPEFYFFEVIKAYNDHNIPLRNKRKFAELGPIRQDEIEIRIRDFFTRNGFSERVPVFQVTNRIMQSYNAYEWLRCSRFSEKDALPKIDIFPISGLIFEIAQIRKFNVFRIKKDIEEELNYRKLKLEISTQNRNCFFHNRIKINVCPIGENNRLIEASVQLIRDNLSNNNNE